ncbi:hypothetical protein DBV05_g8231 [Lasiodiplodia theobromae]|uniref:Uncharacterized protein n=1 Tax=Lasiodiplodia theobromae TaxID=45133 RepID=A0A5N5D667_9PEZI|nr:hypothetical protein DBV05_g8231 [Lasiodiplodia theobromae]
MLLKSRAGVLPFGILWLLLLFCSVLAPGADSRAVITTENLDLKHALTNITKLMKKDVGTSCDISLCEIDGSLCETDPDNNDGDEYDDDCDEDNLDDCPPAEVDTTDDTAAKRRTYEVRLGSGAAVILTGMNYPSIGKLLKTKKGSLVYQYAMQPENSESCENTFVVANKIQGTDPPESTVTEHILELQTISQWVTKVSSGNLITKVDDKCFTDFWVKSSLPSNIPKMQSGAFKTSTVPNDRVFEAMGSFRNRGILLIADSQINLIKARIWSGLNIFQEQAVNTLSDNAALSDEDAGKAMGMIVRPIQAFNYLNNLQTRSRLYDTIDGVRDQLQVIENNIPQCSGLAASWDEFIPPFLEQMATKTADWLERTTRKILDKFEEALNDNPDDSDLEDRFMAVETIADYLEDAALVTVKAPVRPLVRVEWPDID